MNQRKFKIALALLCILLILACTSIVFIPHAHECAGVDCSVCAIIETSRNLLLGAAISAALCQSPYFSFIIHNTRSYMKSIKDGTPVGLKVKLSD